MNAHVALTPDDLATLYLPDCVHDGRQLVWLGDDGGRTYVYVTAADCRAIGDAWHNVADGLDTGLDERPFVERLVDAQLAARDAKALARGRDIARQVLDGLNRGGAL